MWGIGSSARRPSVPLFRERDVSDGRHGQALPLRPTGRLDVDSCAALRHQLAAAFAAGVESVVVDLSAVTAVDLTGLRVLAGAARHLAKLGGGLVVIHASSAIVTSMRINGMGDLVERAAALPLRLVAGSGTGGRGNRPRTLTVVPPEGLKLPG